MTSPELLGLAAAMHDDAAAPARLRKGVVVDVPNVSVHPTPNTLRQQVVRVTLAGSTTALDVRSLVPVHVGDSVWLLQQGPVLLVIGSAASYPNGTRTVTTVNAALPSGFYEVVNDANAPTLDWYHVVHTRHTNDSTWGWQTAYLMIGDEGRVYTRRNLDGGADPTLASSWSPWVDSTPGAAYRGGIHRTTDQAITGSTDTFVQFTAGRGYDEGSSPDVAGWWNSGVPTRLTVPPDVPRGTWLANTTLPIVVTAGTVLNVALYAYTSGDAVKGVYAAHRDVYDTAATIVVNLSSRPIVLGPGDYVGVLVRTDGGSATINSGYYVNPYVVLTRVSG